ncbi:hypothetical protein MLD38_028330 [Melastoma candidum]|uniref:Uncharacterized protein n=1 Tax=Melastoma candidum TaxID=119954 RepID=A0ACB9N532_9MYRT|nr:hypothetical protein MLD38_028330 [Melastoma candidum]
MHHVGSFGSGDTRGCPVLELANVQVTHRKGAHLDLAGSSHCYNTLLKKDGNEFIGTYMLIFAAAATLIINQKSKGAETLLGPAASTGLVVMEANYGGLHEPNEDTGACNSSGKLHAIWVYLKAPVIGALIGAATYTAVRLPDDNSSEEHRRRRP